MKFLCLGDDETVLGFRLAGIAGQVVATPEQAREALQQAFQDPQCAIVILSEEVAATIASLVEDLRMQRERPWIVLIPGPNGPRAGKKGLSDLVRAAVGVQIDEPTA